MSKSLDITAWAAAGDISLPALLGLIALATLISEDLTCISAGLLVAQGVVGYLPATLACLVGIYTGDLLLYLAGRKLARPALRRAPLKWVVRYSDIERSADWFRHHGPAVVIASRFMPGTRVPTYVAAGALRMPVLKFSGYFLAAVALWTPLLVGLAVTFGRAARAYFSLYHKYALLGFVILALFIWVAVRLVVPLFSYKGRRLLLSSWRRKTRWEFWPPWIFYAPILLYVIYLGIKHRGFTLFTAANPAMPAGGFIGESKADILRGLSASTDFIAKYTLVKGSESSVDRCARITAFMEREHLRFPIVLKPDVGQRGAGVAIVKSQEEVAQYVAAATWDILAQEFLAGHEFGVFYYRPVDALAGRIFSITDKRFPAVTGDGVRNLEGLILADDRAVCVAPLYLRLHHDHLYDVPAAGEEVQLVEIGTHCRGALFRNGDWVRTPQLEAVFDEISREYTGFFLGRYDVRTPSIEDFRQGRNFKILELNGVTSEATHIYEPGSRLRDGYRTLMQQWRLAFEIGAENARRGVAPTSLAELAQGLARYETPELG